MSAIKREIAEAYPNGSRWWVFIQDEMYFRDFGCGWRHLTIVRMGHKKVRLEGYGVRRNVKRQSFFDLNPRTDHPCMIGVEL